MRDAEMPVIHPHHISLLSSEHCRLGGDWSLFCLSPTNHSVPLLMRAIMSTVRKKYNIIVHYTQCY